MIPRLQILVGDIELTGNGGDEGWLESSTITFQTPFKHIPFISLIQTTGHSTENYNISSLTTTQLRIKQFHVSGSTFTFGYRWFAIGFY